MRVLTTVRGYHPRPGFVFEGFPRIAVYPVETEEGAPAVVVHIAGRAGLISTTGELRHAVRTALQVYRHQARKQRVWRRLIARLEKRP